MKKETIKKHALQLLFLVIGLVAGRLFFVSSPAPPAVTPDAVLARAWTCSMHPNVRQDAPGTCPLCGMDLVPVESESESADDHPVATRLSPSALALADVRVTRVSDGIPVKELSLHGVIRRDERLARAQVAHVKGRVEKLLVHSPGERVRRGDPVARLTSPDLLNARQELIEAAREGTDPAILEAAREKLRLWKLSDAQIRETEQSGVASPDVEMLADVEGIITARRVNEGDYVAPGSLLFEVADLSRVWAVFNAYEEDLPYLHVGATVEYALPALPGKRFSGKIALVEPGVDENTRVVAARVETPNPDGELAPGMYARATVRATARGATARQVIIPASAVLWTGRRSLVYTRPDDNDPTRFIPRDVELGPSLGDAYVVLSGLRVGEQIVARGAFAIDASAQLEGKRSMMNDAPDDDAREETLPVQGLCEMCRERVEEIALGMTGVRAASWDSQTRSLALRLAPRSATLDAIAAALAAAGHDAGRFKADDEVYNALPACCKYRDEP
ncbi:MAG: efflux RND transporter periplasmic adaptor subunit [Odoribacteraceae bacterium]|jgi:Cu(I)/Ag(I) efflux system membrane fusion protein|nr:efflux RND transporter periplasmic adaptor subunit [Odoribacteraceae bacterium]